MFSSCKKSEDVIDTPTKYQNNLRKGDASLETDPNVFNDFTGSEPNPFQPIQINKFETPNKGGETGPLPESQIHVIVRNFQPFAGENYVPSRTQLIDLKTYYREINQGQLYDDYNSFTSSVFYNVHGIPDFDVRDIPPGKTRNFRASFEIRIPSAITYAKVYARLYYFRSPEEYGGMSSLAEGNAIYTNKINEFTTNNYYGASAIVPITIDERIYNRYITVSIDWKLIHDPKNLFDPNTSDEDPRYNLELPQSGYYDVMLLVANSEQELAFDLKRYHPLTIYAPPYYPWCGNDAFYDSPHDYNELFIKQGSVNIVRHALHVTVLNDEFDVDITTESILGPPFPFSNIYWQTWWPGSDNGGGIFSSKKQILDENGNIVYAISIQNDTYTKNDYTSYDTIPDNNRYPLYFHNDSKFITSNFSYGGSPNNLKVGCNGQIEEGEIHRNFSAPYCKRPIKYGTITARIYVPEILNSNNFPTGIFPAFWLYEYPDPLVSVKYGNEDVYKLTRHCENNGYYTQEPQLQPQEIDIEIFSDATADDRVMIATGIVDFA
ncbi:MAG: hypothetical protein A3H98_04785 [Bacteroidetes bacterium RIFCSPLOWO2_02_FULL_36_8]|nr:MAG: hypothetical protein A3H98_04785 [Bacteroidetes bacterium RIFCSPLOWO2_02_FULL_36_8]OFY69666.1 MAG: hypothetical protein A3G23_14145 [Bacteroidetes bacterium RIFCSPLOWO2_12_FULL_37_12]